VLQLLYDSRFSQAGQVLVGHPADPLVDVVEVDQQELGVALQLLLVGLGFGLKEKECRQDARSKFQMFQMSVEQSESSRDK